MWNALAQSLSDTLNAPFDIKVKQHLRHSSADHFYRISDGNQQYFVKVAPLSALERFECEAQDLALLTRESLFMVPDCLLTGTSVEYCFNVLEWLDLDANESHNWSQMGEYLALMHSKHEQGMFGNEQENYIGITVQPNQWHKKWDVFFSEERIGWQLQLLAEKGFVLCDIDSFVDYVKQALHHHHIKPSLLHGDLWRGNAGFHNGVPCFFDPACYYGDREVDIAMTKLFGTFPSTFYDAYQHHYPLQYGFEQREAIYNLYHLLNHANIFAGQYLAQAKETIDNLLK
ncbi:fructosamine kinase family protein [Pseudoalteromonas sp. SSDWG2]|uniref:fructosamine kinase family protein n=1 Tax=Pseudoalteromonas sp. SSDWG2 TaxID=3139391 RepID=UPI003BAC179C